MIKRIVVAGCRNYKNYKKAKEFIEFCIGRIKKEYTLIFLSGGCRGANKLGERHAAGYKIEFYPAQWEKYGADAGPKRNRQMAEPCDYVICFWDGQSRGTRSMIQQAKALGRPVKICRITCERFSHLL